MAAPSWTSISGGVVITTGSAAVGDVVVAVGQFIALQVLQDGTGTGPTLVSTSNIVALDGTTNTMTKVGGAHPVGSPTAANQHVWLGRASAAAVVTATVSTPGDDLYCALQYFQNVSTGTTLATVIENGSAGSSVNGVGTSTSVADTGVTTLGVDRLACNFVAINDDATGIVSFTGETGGDWTRQIVFESSTGTDGTICVQTAPMASAGTINGGASTITSDGWGVLGFALIGTTAAITGPPVFGRQRRADRFLTMR